MTNAISKNRVREFLPSNWEDVDALLGQVFGPTAARARRAVYAPASLWEDEGSYHLELDVPGISREDIGLTFEKGVLEIVAERKAPAEERKGLHDERLYGKLTRKLTLPESIDPDSIEAEVSDGVLHVTVAKTPETQPKRIEIK